MVTIQEIAKRVGVSVATVSNVLNGRNKNLWRSTQERAQLIRQVAEEMGYRPNAAARAIAAGKHRCLALVLAQGRERANLPVDTLAGIHVVANEKKQNIVLVRLPDQMLTDQTYMPRVLEESFSDGLLVDYTHGFPQRMVELIREFAIPAVWMNSKLPTDCIFPDDIAAGREATEHLLSLGHRRIAYVDYSHGPTFPTPHYSTHDRRAGYELAMHAAGLRSRVVQAEHGYDVPSPDRVEFSKRILSGDDRPTAVVGYSTDEVQPLAVAAMCIGLSIPRDLSLVSFAGQPVKWLGPLFTTWLVPEHELGRRAAEMLLTKISHRQTVYNPIPVPFTVLPGASCAGPAV